MASEDTERNSDPVSYNVAKGIMNGTHQFGGE